jgi:hypothetical protein
MPKQRVFDFLGDPNRPHQKIDQSLKERRLVALDEMPHEQHDPSHHKKRESHAPERKNRQNNPHENDWNANSMEQLIPLVCMLVVVLRHVFLKGGQKWLLDTAGPYLYAANQ